MSLYQVSVPQFIKTLKNLDGWLDKAVAYAAEKSFDPVVLLNSRLAPDQYPLLKQIQIACDTAKFTASYLSGKEAPAHPDTEQTVDEIRARIKATIAFLETISAKDFEGAEERVLSPRALRGKRIKGGDYLAEFGLANFYFHATTAYAILRHNGVNLGKRDYIGSLTLLD